MQALDIYPTASAYCNIALSFARPSPFRDIDLAIEYAGKALELDSSQVRHWHLLGLLLSAVERWDAAKEILEQGAEVGESAIEEAEKTITEVDGEGYTTALQTPTATMLNGEGVEVKDFAKKPGSLTDTITDNDLTPMQSSVQPRLLLLSSHDAEIPASAMLLKPLPDRPTLSKVEAFDRALQIRMSLGALTEVLEGAEGAEIKWLEIFGWVATWMGLSDGDSLLAVHVVFLANPFQERAQGGLLSMAVCGNMNLSEQSQFSHRRQLTRLYQRRSARRLPRRVRTSLLHKKSNFSTALYSWSRLLLLRKPLSKISGRRLRLYLAQGPLEKPSHRLLRRRRRKRRTVLRRRDGPRLWKGTGKKKRTKDQGRKCSAC